MFDGNGLEITSSLQKAEGESGDGEELGTDRARRTDCRKK